MRFILIPLVFFTVNSYCQSLSETFSIYQVEKLNSEEYFQKVSNPNKSNFTLEIGGFELFLTPSSIISDNYKCVNSKGIEITDKNKRAIPMKGFTREGYPVSISIAPGFIYGSIQLPNDEWIIQPLYIYEKNANPNTFITYFNKDRLLNEEGTCGIKGAFGPKTKNEYLKNRSTGGCYDVDYAVCSDYLMYQEYGSNATNVENQVIAVTNDVNTLYDNEFADAIQFRITGQVIIDCSGCDPWTTSTNAGTLLPDFRTWSTNNLESTYNITYDISSLWTDRDFNGSTIGLAYTQPAICSSNKTNNILQDYTSNPTGLRRLTAHEIGHNFSTQHDGTGGFVMSPSVNSASDNWSNQSINTIENRYTNNGGCLTTPCAPTTPEISWVESSQSVSEAASSNSSACGLPYTDIDILLNKSVYTQASVGVQINVEPSGTTANNLDYELLTTNITFTSGGALNQPVTIRIYDDIIEEGNETLELSFTISNGTANLGAITNYILTIESSGDIVSNECCSGGQSTVVGIYNFNASAFTAFNNTSSRSRYIIPATELSNAGLVAGEISQIDLYVQTKNSSGSIDNFRVNLANYSSTTVPNSWIPTTNVFDQTITTTTGWNPFVFNQSFSWDGTSNLYIELCFENGNTDGVDQLRSGIYSGNIGSFVTNFSGSICSNSPNGWTNFNYKPQTRIYTDGGAKIESQVQAAASGKLAVGETGHFYSVDEEVILSIKNIGAQDIDCMDVSIHTAGNGRSNFIFGNDQYSNKTFFIDADNEASYEATLYYKTTELSVWGSDNLNLQMAKSSQPFNIALNENVYVTNPLQVNTNIGADNGIAYTGSFTGFGYLTVTGAKNSPLPESDSDLVFGNSTDGLILTSPNGSMFLINESVPGMISISPATNLPVSVSTLDWNVYVNDAGSSVTFKSSTNGYSKYSVDNNGTLVYSNIGSLPNQRIMVENGNFKLSKPGTGLILKAPNASCYKLGVSDGGILEVIEIGCP